MGLSWGPFSEEGLVFDYLDLDWHENMTLFSCQGCHGDPRLNRTYINISSPIHPRYERLTWFNYITPRVTALH